MKRLRQFFTGRGRASLSTFLAMVAIGILLLYRLGSLIGGISKGEHSAIYGIYGWHGIYRQPFYAPLNIVRSAVTVLFSQHSQVLARLPNVILGLIAIVAFGALIRLWHGKRIALLTTALFATSAWTLHVSRLASYDVLYLAAAPCLLLIHSLLQRRFQRPGVWYGSLLTWLLLLYVPGLVWLIVPDALWLRRSLIGGWRHFNRWWQRLLSCVVVIVFLPLLIVDLMRPGQLRLWLGLPAHFAPLATLGKQFVAVFVHLFIRGPEYPQVWLGQAPVLDIFTLVMGLLGIAFYANHYRASRTLMLGCFFIVGAILIAFGGPVGLSLLVPVIFAIAATGIAYLLRSWLAVFPLNPLGRTIGLGFLTLAVTISCVYNVRAYFVAWPHNNAARTTFHYRLK